MPPPDRTLPWLAGPISWNFEEQETPEGVRLVAFTLDTSDTRVITFWARDDWIKLCQTTLELLGERPKSLVVADMTDLGKLGRNGPASPSARSS